MRKHAVLFVDDEPMVTDALKRALRKQPYAIFSARSAKEAFGILESEEIDVVISDEKMPGMSGTDFLIEVRRLYPDTIRMILTGQASLDVAIRAINEGRVYRFFSKPCNEVDLAMTILHALQQKDLAREARNLLNLAQRQRSVIERMKQIHPELLKIERDNDGTILINETTEEYDLEKLIGEISGQVTLGGDSVAL